LKLDGYVIFLWTWRIL